MLNNLKNAVNKRAKRVFRDRDQKHNYASELERLSPVNGQGTNGAAKSRLQPSQQEPVQRPSQDGPKLDIPGHPVATQAKTSHNSAQGNLAHPGVDQLTAETGVSKGERLRESLSAITRDQRFGNSNFSPEITITAPLERPIQVPSTYLAVVETPPKEEEHICGGCGTSPLIAAIEDAQKTDLGHMQSTDEALASSMNNLHFVEQRKKFPTKESQIIDEERLHRDLSSGKVYDPHGEMDNDSGQDTAMKNVFEWDLFLDSLQNNPNVTIDHTVHNMPVITQEEIHPQVHTIYEVQRTRSIHFHDYTTTIEPIADPKPTILPTQHWAQDSDTGQIYRISDEQGRRMMEAAEAC